MLQEFYMSGFRNLETQMVSFDAPFNLVVGPNGSGKTSLLESIYTLLNGKSFRTTKTSNIVCHSLEAQEFVLRAYLTFGDDNRRSVGLKKSVNERYLAKVDGEVANSIADLASVWPTQIVEPRSFNLLEGGAGARRRLLDWIVFHVEPSFGDLWKRYSAVLKQRAALLKQRDPNIELIAVWDTQLASLGEAINNYREPIVGKVVEVFRCHASELLGSGLLDRLKIGFYPGWSNNLSLGAALSLSREKDVKRRTTHYGAHKSDLRFGYDGLPVHEGLSRGQQKLLVLAWHLAQIEVLKSISGRSSLLLLDDLAAELDERNTSLFIESLNNLGVSVVATGLDIALYQRVLSRLDLLHKARMFHVEHGKIERL